MEYDDTDFQSQNFQLAGEDNSKPPSGLRPFALPKLDTDDQLQGHLRFGNLTDSEGFFSVGGHDNSWIEVLSTGSTVVDFSSSAAESCSISRSNYVWSEATSTECVEMLLKSVGENEMTGNMDDNVHQQLSGMDSQICPSNMQPKSSDSPSDSIVVPAENDQSQGTRSRMPEDPLTSQPQFEDIAPFSMVEKAEHAAASTLSGRKSNYMLDSVSEKCIVSEKLSSASQKTPEGCPAVDNYFKVVHDGDSLDNLNIHSAGVDSDKLSNEAFSELARIQNIYSTGSYHFEQGNHMHANKLEGMHELQKMTESSDGLLEAITNPVKMLQMNDDTCKSASDSLQPPLSEVEHAAEGHKISVDAHKKFLIEKFVTGEEPTSAKSCQNQSDLNNSNPRPFTPLSTESSELIQSPDGKQVAHVTEAPEETESDGVEDTIVDISKHEVPEQHQESVHDLKNVVMDDTSINNDVDSKLGVLEQHQDSVDNLQCVVLEEQSGRDEISAVSGNFECLVEAGHAGNDRGLTGTSKDEFESSGHVSPDNSSALLFDKNGPNVSSVNHEGPVKEDDTPVLEDKPGTNSGSQEKEIAPLINNLSSDIVCTTVADTSNKSMDKPDCSGGVPSDGSLAGVLEGNDSTISSINHVDSVEKGANSTSEVGGHNVASVPESLAKKSAMSVNSDINSISSSGTDPVAKNPQCEGLATSLGSLTTNQNQDKSGDHPDAHTENCQVDRPPLQSEDQEISHPQKCQIGGSSVQSGHHGNLATASSLDVSSGKGAQTIIETPLNAKDDLNVHIKDNEGSCNDGTCGSPTVISCTEPCLQEGGQEGMSVLHSNLTEQSEDKKDPTASAGAFPSSEDCSARNIKHTLTSAETNTTGDDRSFSFEVGNPPKVSEKVHRPAWSPFPRSKAALSTEVNSEVPKPGTPGNVLKHTSEVSKKTSVLETGKEQQSGSKVVESVGVLSSSSHIGHSTETKSAPLEQPQQHPTPEISALAHQPFTDLQHVQLRAQIFVYGALIQGIPPAEAYMVSAFGEPVGGGKPAWEAVWRVAVKIFQNLKSPVAGLETPTSSRIGSHVAEKASKGTAGKTSPTSKKGGKTVLPAHTAVTLHSPTFNMSPLGSSTLNLQRGSHLDFSQAVSPVFAYNSQTRQPTSAVASWFPQSPGPRAAPWLAPPQNLIFDSSMQPTVPSSDSAKGSSISISQAITPGLFLPTQASSTVASPLAVVQEEKQKTPASKRNRAGAASPKPRKRKKASVSQEQQPDIASSQLNTDVASSQLKTDIGSVIPATEQTPGFTLSTRSPSNVLGSRLVPNASLITSVPNYLGGKGAEQRIIFSEQISGAVDQSMDQARGASMYSEEALRHSEGVWNQLSANSRSKLPAEVEQKLTSAAASASAAVSVAKAAAEAAKMASAAALQAKMMAEEALGSTKSANSLQKRDTGEVDVNNMASVSSLTPKSSWKIKDSTNAPGSTISVAREVARKRVEEASAAAKRAENLDAILKAAELAAEAVFKAGTLIGLGEPLPFTLSELLEAGPDGYWKSDRVKNTKAGNTSENVATEELEIPADKSGRKHDSRAKYGQAIQNLEPSSSVKSSQPDKTPSGNGIEDNPTAAPLNGNTNDTAPSIIWNGIGKGSLVEVFAAEGGSRAAWFSAKVLDINEDNACISYEAHGEGTGLPKEWVSLKQEGEKAPQIRLAHPATVSNLKGTRKRRRDTAQNYSWAVGDHVDAWIKNSWREGIISQNGELCDTKFVVQFSAGDSLVLDAWNLRPSLVWQDGKWTEWSRARERKDKSNKGDSPYEKRQRTAVSDPVPVVGEARPPSKDKKSTNTVVSDPVPTVGEARPPTKDKKSTNTVASDPVLTVGEARPPAKDKKSVNTVASDPVLTVGEARPFTKDKKSVNTVGKPDEPRPLALSDRDVLFNIGKGATEIKTTRRPGLQKEGTKVFGVPKPGKKKKFMDVSKHYVGDQADKISEGSAASRFAKHPVPQVPRPRESTLKLDQRAKRASDMRSRGLKSAKSQTTSTNSVPGEGPSSTAVPSSSALESTFAFAASTASSSNPVNITVENNNSTHATDLRTEDASIPESRLPATPTIPAIKKNPSAANRAKRKFVPSADSNVNRRVLKTPDVSAKTSSDSAEPRRSNRRIQPTSRLLEGLQSSLIASKITGEKVPRTNFRSATSASRGKAHG
ncbi:uncharacterized protein LOC123439612 isoform X1 [Hordeum vulgare subsp. vulgare]|uniref:Agenet domain-containing protein n=1 Tax=Hordeum vulgare subsp. vulgare TaxID=112509 RepID=A0A8I7B3B2_HORVV|nr:uncharacterized protein LOC123439612 isoform X1 [Hordeum vulgare subsp. vulgare]